MPMTIKHPACMAAGRGPRCGPLLQPRAISAAAGPAQAPAALLCQRIAVLGSVQSTAVTGWDRVSAWHISSSWGAGGISGEPGELCCHAGPPCTCMGWPLLPAVVAEPRSALEFPCAG